MTLDEQAHAFALVFARSVPPAEWTEDTPEHLAVAAYALAAAMRDEGLRRAPANPKNPHTTIWRPEV